MKGILKWLVIGWVAFWSLLLLFVVLAIVFHDAVGSNRVLRVTVRSPIVESEAPSLTSVFEEEGPITVRALTESLRHAATDDRIKGVLLDVKERPASIAQLEEIEEAMAVYRASKKPSVAFLETAGEFSRGDATYAFAALADEIVLAPSGDVNLAGLRAEVPFLRGLFDKLDIEPSFDKRYAYKTAANTFTETKFTPEHKQSLSELVDDLQEQLIELIAARRAIDANKVWEWIKTGPHEADDALKFGLVNKLAYIDEVEADLKAKAGDPEREDDDVFLDVRSYARALPSPHGDKLAVIRASGVIMRGEGEGGGDSTLGSDTLVQAFRDAREAEVKGILFRVDSPGGSYIASDLIRREVMRCKEAKIPIVVSMAGVAASGGYFVAMDADRIVAEPGTLTGSIGVYGGSFATRAFFEKWLGVTFGVYETAPEAVAFSNLDPPDEHDKEKRAQALDRIYKDFTGKVAAARNKTQDEIHAVAQGRVWSGRAARERGLVDELGGMDAALAKLKEIAGIKGDAALVAYPNPPGFMTQLKRILDAGAQAHAPLLRFIKSFMESPDDSLLALPFDVSIQ